VPTTILRTCRLYKPFPKLVLRSIIIPIPIRMPIHRNSVRRLHKSHALIDDERGGVTSSEFHDFAFAQINITKKKQQITS